MVPQSSLVCRQTDQPCKVRIKHTPWLLACKHKLAARMLDLTYDPLAMHAAAAVCNKLQIACTCDATCDMPAALPALTCV